MAVVINEFEAVAEPQQERRGENAAGGPPKRVEPAQLLPALRRIAERHARLRAH